jgi:hypothetical protein
MLIQKRAKAKTAIALFIIWCGKGDSNPHDLSHHPLKAVAKEKIPLIINTLKEQESSEHAKTDI